jgi:hypothetical protein
VAVTPSIEYAITHQLGVSAGLGMFLGGVLRPRRSMYDRPWRTALGYQFDVAYDAAAALLLRHRVMATGHGGNRGRFFYQLGGGFGTGLEGAFLIGAAARIGFAVPEPQWRFNGLVIGGSVAMDGAVFEDPTPILRLGLFLGWAWI